MKSGGAENLLKGCFGANPQNWSTEMQIVMCHIRDVLLEMYEVVLFREVPGLRFGDVFHILGRQMVVVTFLLWALLVYTGLHRKPVKKCNWEH